MRKRYAVLGLSVVLAVALAVPAFGGPSNPIGNISATAKQTANKALKRSNQAKRQAKNAMGRANNATSTANSANAAAKKAQTDATKAQETADGALGAAAAAQAAAEQAEANANTRIKGSSQVFGTTTPSNNTTPKTSSANCPATQPVVGGGYFVTGEGNKVTVITSNNQLYGHGWLATGEAISGMNPTWAITAIVMCGTQ